MNEEKQCNNCKKNKPLSEFYRVFRGGEWKYRARCKKCLVADAIQRRAKSKRD